MPIYRCEAMGADGEGQNNQLEAANANEAMRIFSSRGLFVTKVVEVTSAAAALPAGQPLVEPAKRESTRPQSEQSVASETPPGSQIHCRTIGRQLAVSIAPGSGLSAGFLGSFPLLFIVALVLFTLAVPLIGLRGNDYWLLLPLSLLWVFGLVLSYFWLRGRFGKTQVLIEQGLLVIDFELFGRHRMREYVLAADSCASLVADFYESRRRMTPRTAVYHLHVTTAEGSAKFGTYLSNEEKQWLVKRINLHLGRPV